MDRLRVTEYLDLDLSDEGWYCHECGNGFGSARGNYKAGCLIHERDPREIHQPLIEGEYALPLFGGYAPAICPSYLPRHRRARPGALWTSSRMTPAP